MMKNETISTEKAPGAIGPYSQAIKTANMIFCSGQIPIDPATGEFVSQNVAKQTEQVIKRFYAALIIFPDLMQRVQTFIRPFPPAGSWTRIDCRFGSKRRRVLLFACETLFPNCGPLPHTSHRFAIY